MGEIVIQKDTPGLVYLVSLVYLVCLVGLVPLVSLVYPAVKKGAHLCLAVEVILLNL